MKKTKKILVLGISQSNFLNQLYGDLIRKDDSLSVHIDGFFDISKSGANENSIYRQHLNFKTTKVSGLQLYKSLFAFMRTAFFWQIFYFERSQGKTFREAKSILFSYAWSKFIVENVITKSNYDIFHFHYCNPENLKFAHFLPKESKIICSFWGSDLMRETGTSNVFYVRKALAKANLITIQSQELAEMLYCKYGREFTAKTKIVQFTIHTGIYEKMDVYKSELSKVSEFKKEKNIPADKTIIAISHNAYAANNHIPVIESLLKLSSEEKNKIAVVLPLGYGRHDDYLKKLEDFVSAISDFPIIPLHNYLNPEETALLRIATDLMIQMPISDALSGAMTEVLYAGNHVIAGSWLPYGILRRNGLAFGEAETFDIAAQLVSDYLSAPEKYKTANETNDQKIRSFLFPQTTTANWLAIFNAV
ncbi:MAG TPA: glycosyltransferase [Flavobacterium sp.]|nr:glycosyltransferase [Flavobacterium sp.]